MKPFGWWRVPSVSPSMEATRSGFSSGAAVLTFDVREASQVITTVLSKHRLLRFPGETTFDVTGFGKIWVERYASPIQHDG